MPPLGSQVRLRLEALALDRPRARRAAALAGVSYVAWRLLPRLRRLYRATVDWRDPVLPRDLRALRVPLAAADVEDEIREKRAVVDGAAREVAWAAPGRRTRTALAVVYVHGWGACRQEIAPTPQLLARALGANLYCHRLSGHGRRRAAAPATDPPSGDILLAEATPRRLFLDALEAFRVGLALGDRVVVVGVSTGGGLATWLAARVADEPEGDRLAALVLVSPCYGLGHPLYPFLKKPFTFLRLVPFGLAPPLRAWLLAALMGREKRSPAVSPDHARYNALAYPHPALLHLVDVLYGLEGLDVSRARAPTFLVANHGDAVIDFGRAARVFEALGAALPSAPPKVMVACPSDAHPHVLASQMLSPNTVDGVLDAAILFVRAHTGRDAGLRRKAAPSRPPSFGSVTGLDALMRPFPF